MTRRLFPAALATLLLAACSVTDETMGTRPSPSGGGAFREYVAIGTSVGAGIQSGGINDSTQRETYAYQLAVGMGLTPGADWFYPRMRMPGCPAPFTNPLTGARVANATATGCALRDPASAAPWINNASVPSIRAYQVLNLDSITPGFANTDTLKLAQFLTGSVNPIDWVRRARATFVTLEIGANDVLGAATRGNAALLTPLAEFQAAFTAIADTLDAQGVAVAAFNVPNVVNIPHFSAGVVFFCLKTGAPGCPVPATVPYSLPSFTVDASCAPTAGGGVGDQMFTAFTTTATITQVLAGGGAASLNCGAGTATVTTGAGTGPAGPVLSQATTAAIVTQVTAMNTFIAAQAATRGWAFVDLNGLLDSVRTAAAGNVPPFPNFPTPGTLFGPFISLDGIHPNRAAHRLLARRAAVAINAAYTTSIVVP